MRNRATELDCKNKKYGRRPCREVVTCNRRVEGPSTRGCTAFPIQSCLSNWRDRSSWRLVGNERPDGPKSTIHRCNVCTFEVGPRKPNLMNQSFRGDLRRCVIPKAAVITLKDRFPTYPLCTDVALPTKTATE